MEAKTGLPFSGKKKHETKKEKKNSPLPITRLFTFSSLSLSIFIHPLPQAAALLAPLVRLREAAATAAFAAEEGGPPPLFPGAPLPAPPPPAPPALLPPASGAGGDDNDDGDDDDDSLLALSRLHHALPASFSTSSMSTTGSENSATSPHSRRVRGTMEKTLASGGQ